MSDNQNLEGSFFNVIMSEAENAVRGKIEVVKEEVKIVVKEILPWKDFSFYTAPNNLILVLDENGKKWVLLKEGGEIKKGDTVKITMEKEIISIVKNIKATLM